MLNLIEMRPAIREEPQPLHDLFIVLDEYGSILNVQFLDADVPHREGTWSLHDILPMDVVRKIDGLISQPSPPPANTYFEFRQPGVRHENWFAARLKNASNARYLLSVHDITKYKQKEIRMGRQIYNFSMLRAIDSAIASGLDQNLLLSILQDRIIEILQVDAVAILTFDPHSNDLSFSSGRGFHAKFARHAGLRLGEGYAGRIALDRRMIYIPSVSDSNAPDFDHQTLFPEENFAAYCGVPLITRGRILGVLELYHRSSLSPDDEWLDFLKTITHQASIALDSTNMFKELQKLNFELEISQSAMIDTWSRAVDLRVRDSEGHTRRVADLTTQFARQVGLTETDLIHIQRGAILHDIGKLAIPDEILLKPGPLTDDEWQVVRKHPDYAVELLTPMRYLEPALEIPHWHHEKWDGTGYPDHLKGEEIPQAARIFALADVYDALTSDRVYRKAWSKKSALEYIQSEAGRHFDPDLVPQFISMAQSRH